MVTKSWKSEVFEKDSPEKLADAVVQFLNKNGLHPNEIVTYWSILSIYR